MARRLSLSLHWPLHRRRVSQSQPSSPVSSVLSRDTESFSPMSPTTPSLSMTDQNSAATKADMRLMATEAWKKVEGLIEDHWEWPPSADQQPLKPLGFNIAQDQLYREREQSITPPPPDEGISPTSSIGYSIGSTDLLSPSFKQVNNSETKPNLSLEDERPTTPKNEDEEVTWNDGLRIFNERRNAWTGAVEVNLPEGTELTYANVQLALEAQKALALTSRPNTLPNPNTSLDTNSHINSLTSSTSKENPFSSIHSIEPSYSGSSPQSSFESKRPSLSNQEPSEPTPPSSFHYHNSPQRHKRHNNKTTRSTLSSGSISPCYSPTAPLESPPPSTPPQATPPLNNATTKTLIPPYNPLFPPSNRLRKQCSNPKNYPSIYRNLISESHKPHLPINLSDVVRATVQGWKGDGTWPSTEDVRSQDAMLERVRERQRDRAAERAAEREREAKQRRRRSFRGLLDRGKEVVGGLVHHGDGKGKGSVAERGDGKFDGEDGVEGMFEGVGEGK